MLKKQTPFWLIIFGIIAGLVLPALIRDGMFVDGLFYSVVSKNLANGLGTFWFPYYSESGFGGLRDFHEHPPFVFALQSIFFHLFGSSLYTERIYIFIILCLNIFIMMLIWKTISTNDKEKNTGWLPLLFWILVPLSWWSFQNNMMENTMGVFVLLSVYFYLRCMQGGRKGLIMLLLSGASIFLASFSKGIPGLFTLSMPILFWISTQTINISRMLYHSGVLVMSVAGFYGILLLSPAARDSLSIYFFERVVVRIGHAPTVDSHFLILKRLATELLPPVVLLFLVIGLYKYYIGFRIGLDRLRLSSFFILLGFAGSVPLMFTLVQRGFYFVPALPLFAIGFAHLVSAYMTTTFAYLAISRFKKYFFALGILLCTASLTWTILSIGKSKRDEVMLNDINLMGPKMEPRQVFGIPHDLRNAYSFESYFMRYYEESMIEGKGFPYYITPKNSLKPIPDDYKKVELPTIEYDLYVRSL